MTTLQTSFDALKTALTVKLSAKSPSAILADTSDKLNNKTVAAIAAETATIVESHNAKNNNPHGDTAAKVGVKTAAEITALAATKLPLEQVPFSFFGKMDGNAPPHSINQFMLYITAGIPVLLGGKYYIMPAAQYTLPSSSNVYLHVRLVSGVPTYVLEVLGETNLARTPDSLTNMCVGTFQTNASGIVREMMRDVRRVGKLRHLHFARHFDKYMVVSAGIADPLYEQSGLYYNGDLVLGRNKGITIVQMLYANVSAADTFDTDLSASENDRMAAFINGIGTDSYVLVFVNGAYAAKLNQTGINALGQLGINTADLASNAKYRSVFTAMCYKATTPAATVRYAGSGTEVNAAGDSNSSLVFEFLQNEGPGFYGINIHK